MNTSKSPLLLFLIFLLLSAPSIRAEDWKLIWSDEFDGPEINTNNWTFEKGRGTGGNWGTGQVDYSTDKPENVCIKDGVLNLTLRNDGAPDNDKNRPYTSARLISQGKQEFTYGRIEARLKGISGQGLGFAFWLLGVDTKTVGWPKCGEVDIAEITGRTPGFNIGTAHYKESFGHGSSQGKYTLPDNQSFEDEFHVFGIEWTKTYIKWYIDDNVYYTMNTSGAINNYRPFARPFFIILSIGVGGSYSGPPDATTIFPKSGQIDWVRVYQNENTAPEVQFKDMSLFEEMSSDHKSIELIATDQEDNISKVDLYINNSLKKSFTEPPYVFEWENVADGCYKLTALAADNLGEISTTAFSYVKVGSGCAQTPYSGSAIEIPGRIETEHFDKGKNGFAFYDADNKNTGEAFRTTEEVDIEKCSDTGGGFDVFSTEKPEFLTYSIRVKDEGSYLLQIRSAGTEIDSLRIILPNSGQRLKAILLPTASPNVWTTTTLQDIPLKAGDDLMKIEILQGGQKLNWLQLIDQNNGIESLSAEIQKIRLYPNPVSEQGYIHCSAGTTLERFTIYSLTGNIIREETIQGSGEVYEFSRKGLLSGLYIAKIITDKGEKSFMLHIL